MTKVGNRRLVKTEGPDYYPTPAWGVRALLEKVSNGDKETTHNTSISVKEILDKLQLQKVVKGGGTVSHIWAVWDKNHSGYTELHWLNVGHKNNK